MQTDAPPVPNIRPDVAAGIVRLAALLGEFEREDAEADRDPETVEEAAGRSGGGD